MRQMGTVEQRRVQWNMSKGIRKNFGSAWMDWVEGCAVVS